MITSSTWDQIEQIAVRHHAAEAARYAPKPAAIRAVFQLCSLLADLEGADRAAVLALLAEEVRPVIAGLAAGV